MSQFVTGVIASSLLRPATGLTIDPVINIAEREASYRANSRLPNLVPNASQVLQCMWAGLLRPEVACRELLCSGILPAPPLIPPGAARNPQWTENREAWWRIVQLSKPVLPFELLRRWWLLTGRRSTNAAIGTAEHLFSRQHLEMRLLRDGIRDEGDFQAAIEVPELAGVGQVLEAYYLGILTPEQADEYLKQLGYLRDAERNLMLRLTRPLSSGGAISLLWRGQLTDGEWRAAMRANGVVDFRQQDLMQQEARPLPTLGDALRLSLRQTIDDDFARQFGLDENIPAVYTGWAQAQGYNYGTPTNVADQAGNLLAPLQLWYWRAGRQLPSPGEARDFLFRLDPGGVEEINRLRQAAGQNADEALRPFSEDDYRAILRANGYPEPYISWTIATAYQLPSIRRLQQGLYYRTIDRTYVENIYLQQGYRPSDAVIAARTDEAVVDDRRNQLARQVANRYTRTAIDGHLKTYSLGNITLEDARHALESIGVSAGMATALLQQAKQLAPALQEYKIVTRTIEQTLADTESLYEIGAISDAEASARIGQLGLSAETRKTILNRISLKVRLSVARAGVAAVRTDFRSGVLSSADAVTKLMGFGITPQRAATYTQEWALQLSDVRRRLTTGQILQMVKDGLLTADLADVRLRNLGWSQPDALLLLADVEHKVAATAAKAQQAAAVKTSKAAAQAVSQIEKTHKQAVGALKTQAGQATLSKWLKDGLITESEFYTLMEARGYGLPYIERYAQAALAPPQPKAPKTSGVPGG